MSRVESVSSKYPRIGEMKHRIVLQQPVLTADGLGGQSRTYDNVATVWAAIETSSGQERFFANKIDEVTIHTFRIRYSTEVVGVVSDTSWRISFDGRLFQIIVAFKMRERNDFISIRAKEGVAS